ncbi:MAG: hypothetical protein ACLRSW_08340 [Christensenellaceae bacterium]
MQSVFAGSSAQSHRGVQIHAGKRQPNCDLALIVCDSTGEYDMQLKTTLDTLREMDFASPYLVVMNKSEGMDTSAFPYGSVVFQPKNLGIDALKRNSQTFSEDFLFCNCSCPIPRSANTEK